MAKAVKVRLPDPWVPVVMAMIGIHNNITVEDVMNAMKIPQRQRNELTHKRISDLMNSQKDLYATSWSRYQPFPHRPI